MSDRDIKTEDGGPELDALLEVFGRSELGRAVSSALCGHVRMTSTPIGPAMELLDPVRAVTGATLQGDTLRFDGVDMQPETFQIFPDEDSNLVLGRLERDDARVDEATTGGPEWRRLGLIVKPVMASYGDEERPLQATGLAVGFAMSAAETEGDKLRALLPFGTFSAADGSRVDLSDAIGLGARKKRSKFSHGIAEYSVGDGVMANDKLTWALRQEKASKGGSFLLELGKKKGFRSTLKVNFISCDATEDQIVRDLSLTAEEINVLDSIYSVTNNNGSATITGSNIMRQMGYQNPYQKNARPEMERILECVIRLQNRQVAYDTSMMAESFTGAPVVASITLTRLVNGSIEVQKDANDVVDFAIHLQPTDPGDLRTALPLWAYSKGVRQFITVRKSVYDIPSAHTRRTRLIRDHIVKQIGADGLGNTILVDTVCREIGVDPEDRKQRTRAVVNPMEAILSNLVNLDEVTAGKRLVSFRKRLGKRKSVDAFELTVADKKSHPRRAK